MSAAFAFHAEYFTPPLRGVFPEETIVIRHPAGRLPKRELRGSQRAKQEERQAREHFHRSDFAPPAARGQAYSRQLIRRHGRDGFNRQSKIRRKARDVSGDGKFLRGQDSRPRVAQTAGFRRLRRGARPSPPPARPDLAPAPAPQSRPGRTISGIPASGVEITGSPAAIASMMTVGKLSIPPSASVVHGSAKRWDARSRAAISDCGSGPVNVTTSPRRAVAICCASESRSGPSPMISQRKGLPGVSQPGTSVDQGLEALFFDQPTDGNDPRNGGGEIRGLERSRIDPVVNEMHFSGHRGEALPQLFDREIAHRNDSICARGKSFPS